MTKFSIDKNVEIPTVHSTVYPFNDMSVGDSFWVPKAYAKSARQRSYKVEGKKFLSRSYGDGMRIWRTK
jgi:hypothetical protein